MAVKIDSGEEKLLIYADDLKRIMKKLMKPVVEAANAVKKIQTEAAPETAEALLTIRAGFTAEDVRFFRAVGELVENDATILESGVSIETLRVLCAVPATDRVEILRAIKAGVPVGEAKMKDLVRHSRWIENGPEQTRFDERVFDRESLAIKNTRAMLRKLEAEALELQKAVADFANQYGPGAPQEGSEMETRRAGYFDTHGEITSKAATVLDMFEAVFGKIDGFQRFEPDGSEKSRLGFSHAALNRLASGHFGHQGGFAFDVSTADVFSWEIIDALDHICPMSSPEREMSRTVTSAPHRLHVLELGAGAGGQALGLMSAGFTHVALYERVKTRVATLKANWPTWPVKHADLSKVSDKKLAQFRGVDLLAGSISSNMVAKQSKKSKRLGDDDLVPTMLRAVRVVQPRAIMIESASGFLFEPHVAYLAQFKADLSDLGYAIESYQLNMKTYGLPRDEKRVVIIGIRHGEPGTFLPPILENPTEKYVSDTLGDLVILHETPADLRHQVQPKTPQRYYNTWAALWKSKSREARISTISRAGTEHRKERSKASYSNEIDGSNLTLQNPFDQSTLAEAPPSVDDFLEENDDFRPKMTRQIASRAQGFPDKWVFKADGGGNIDMIADALPPVMAKAVGLKIYSALTGVTFDLDAAIAKPVVSERLIGLGDARLNRSKWAKSEIPLLAEPWIASQPTVKKRRAKLRSVLQDVEPNHMRRIKLRELVDRAQLERELQAEQDYAWTDHLFPKGMPDGTVDD